VAEVLGRTSFGFFDRARIGSVVKGNGIIFGRVWRCSRVLAGAIKSQNEQKRDYLASSEPLIVWRSDLGANLKNGDNAWHT
jgi:hypothetical protein